ncbi:MAG: xylulokinase [Bryobacter sp.]|nr:xylulokinase [Bryobacter sp.]
MYWLGLDIGTGATRALLVDEKGNVKAGCSAAHAEMTMAQPLWAEQDPDDWWRAAQQAIRGVLAEAGVDGSAVQGVGFSGQMHGLVMLDQGGKVIRPSLIWCDQRSQPQVDEIHTKLGRENVVRWTANPALTGFTLPKLLWVRQHDPASFAQLATVLVPKDYVRFKLSGERAHDVSDASGTGAFAVAERTWSWDVIDGLGLDRAFFPPVYESSAVAGKVSAEAAALTGLREGTPLAAGAGDQAASGVGNGIVRAGIASCTLGTSGVVFAHTEAPAYDPAGRVHTFCHAVPGKWHVMGVTQGAGLSLQWFRKTLAPERNYDELMQEAVQVPAGSEGLYWLPYLMGERTPHLDPLARGAWLGFTARHCRGHLVRSLVEGVSYSQRDCLDVILELGAEVNSVRASGGGARSPFWRQMLADVFACRVTTLASQEGSALGAALLGMVATGHYATVEEACAAAVVEADSLDPQMQSTQVYARGYEVFRTLYPTLKSTFPML